MEIPDAPTATFCAGCSETVLWLWSPRRTAWIAVIAVDTTTMRLHACSHAQDPATWRDIRPVDPETRRRGADLARRAITGEDPTHE